MGTTERLVVDLPSDLVEGLRAQVRAGVFASESEAIETALRPWYGAEDIEGPELEELRTAVAEGIADADAGRVSDAEDVYARIRARIDALAELNSK